MDKDKIIVDYIIANFKLKYEVADTYLNIDYNTTKGAKIRINHSGSGYFNKKEELNLNTVFFKEWNDRNIPFLFGDAQYPLITYDNGNCVINADIIASSFYLLTNWQEQFVKETDRYGRFPFEESIQKKLDFTYLPVVNYYFDMLKTAIEKTYAVKISLRNNSKLSTILSHDIDELEKLWLQDGFHALKKGNVFALPGIVFNHLQKNSTTNPSIKSVLELNKEFNIHSDFFILCSNKHDGVYKNADYQISSTVARNTIQEIVDAENEIGVHGSFFTHQSNEKLADDIQILEKVTKRKIKGNRFHFLSYDCLLTPSILQDCRIQYDSTLGFAEHIGFRNSYADIFLLFDLKNFQSTKVFEFPLALMDASLYFPHYMNCNFDQSVEQVKKLIGEVEKVNGVLVINWHNSSYLKFKNSWLQSLLKEIILICRSKNAAFTTMPEMVRILQPAKTIPR